jgi:hypothetical protein
MLSFADSIQRLRNAGNNLNARATLFQNWRTSVGNVIPQLVGRGILFQNPAVNRADFQFLGVDYRFVFIPDLNREDRFRIGLERHIEGAPAHLQWIKTAEIFVDDLGNIYETIDGQPLLGINAGNDVAVALMHLLISDLQRHQVP